MFRNEPQLLRDLGQPAQRYSVSDDGIEVWRWPCSCLAVRISDDGFQWAPCDQHRPTDWGGWHDQS